MVGLWNREAIEIIQEIWKQIKSVTDDPQEATYLFQRMSKGAVLLMSSSTNEGTSIPTTSKG